ncbi:MAG: 30S ribosomal protein S8 [Deltaproteobacteria bacterium]|nr:30S ribosomal protein S8 [Deltaproteobacteria bacterium]
MCMTDPIADMLTRIRNANRANLDMTDIPYSRIKKGVVEILKEEGFIKNFKIGDNKQGYRTIRVYLKKNQKNFKPMNDLQRISRPGRRIYVKSKDIPSVLNDMGIAILSTSKGIMTNQQAKQKNLGGELLCKVW